MVFFVLFTSKNIMLLVNNLIAYNIKINLSNNEMLW